MNNKYKVNEKIKAVVTNIQPYGAFVLLEDGTSGLVHISQISDDYVKDINLFFTIGEEYEFLVLEYDDEHEHLKLSYKALYKTKKRKSPIVRRNKKILKDESDGFNKLKDMMGVYEHMERKSPLKLDLRMAYNLEFSKYQNRINEIHESIVNRTAVGNDYLGFLDYCNRIQDHDLLKIKEVANYIVNNYDCFVVVGIGGSFLGAKALIEMLKTNNIDIVFFGNSFSSVQASKTMQYLKNRNYCVDIISKSGTTLEPSIAFAFLKNDLVSRYGEVEANNRIYVTTDSEKGLLRTMANQKKYTSFVVPNDVGGRYSLMTPVGLLPMAVAGIDIFDFVLGFKEAMLDFNTNKLEDNIAYQYGLTRFLLSSDKQMELLVGFEPELAEYGKWWQQLFGESEGKDGRGLYPSTANYSTDLHSLGQFIQEGSKILFETFLLVDNKDEVIVPYDKDQKDLLSVISGKDLSKINDIVSEATIKAHHETGKVPCILLHLDSINEKNIGYLCYFFMIACIMSCYLQGVNPTNQPGVEVYKANIKTLLK